MSSDTRWALVIIAAGGLIGWFLGGATAYGRVETRRQADAEWSALSRDMEV